MNERLEIIGDLMEDMDKIRATSCKACSIEIETPHEYCEHCALDIEAAHDEIEHFTENDLDEWYKAFFQE